MVENMHAYTDAKCRIYTESTFKIAQQLQRMRSKNFIMRWWFEHKINMHMEHIAWCADAVIMARQDLSNARQQGHN